MPCKTQWHRKTLGDTGPTAAWLHGWGYDHKGLARIAGLFEKSHQNLLFDLPGFGATAALKNGASTRDYAGSLASILPQTGKAVLIGHSYGGRVAVQYAAHYPDRIAGLILIAGAGLKRKRSLAFKVKAFGLRTVGRAARLSDSLFGTQLRQAYSTRFGSADYKNAGSLRATLVSAVTEDLSSEAARVQCPTLLIYGAEDTDAPPEIGKRYAQLIPGAVYSELAGYDHHDILQRGAYQCEALIKRFLKDIPDA